MRLHERTQHVALAGNQIDRAIGELESEHGLTAVELLQILTAHQQRVLKYMLRDERHPDDPDNGGDEE